MFGLFKKDISKLTGKARDKYLDAEYGEGYAARSDAWNANERRIVYRARTDPNVADKIQMDIDALIQERDMYKRMVKPETERKNILLSMLIERDPALAKEIGAPGGALDQVYAEGLKSPESPYELFDGIDAMRKAAESGHPGAQVAIAEAYYEGNGFDKSHDAAFQWAGIAAKNGYPKAQAMLGALYYNGEGTTQDGIKARHWWGLAAGQGDETARNYLASPEWPGIAGGGALRQAHNDAYHQWRGITTSTDSLALFSGMERLMQEASAGEAIAQNIVGEMYLFGLGFDKSDEQGRRWIALAAEQGLASAQGSMGDLLFDGVGIEAEKGKAMNWWRLAAEQGDACAKEKLEINRGLDTSRSY